MGAVGLWDPSELSTAVVHELRCGIWCAMVMSLSMSMISGTWFVATLDHETPHNKLVRGLGFGSVVGLAQFLSIMTSVVTGAAGELLRACVGIAQGYNKLMCDGCAAPLLFKRMGRDPATLAGP